MRELMTELFDRAGQMNLGSCACRFFTPTEAFWQLIEGRFAGRKFVELGAGRGDTTEEARARGLAWSGIDLHVDMENLTKGVMRLNALRVPLDPSLVFVMPRPDHSGWAQPTLRRCLEGGSISIYVGLDRNADSDLDDLLDHPHEVVDSVGEEGEKAWIFLPQGH